MSAADFLAHVQAASMESDETPAQEPEAGPPDKQLLAYLSNQKGMQPGELQRVMSDKLAIVPATRHPPPTANNLQARS